MTEAKKDAAPKKPRRSGKHLTPRQWAEAEALWAGGEVTMEMLVAKFGKDRFTFHRHFKSRGIKKGAKVEEIKKKAEEELAKAAADEAAVIAARIRETKEEHYKMAAGLAKLTWSEILQAKKDGNPVAVAMNNVKTLELAMNTLKKAREERWAVLGLDKDDYVDETALPSLEISELTADDIEKMKARDVIDDDDLEVEGLEGAGTNQAGESSESDVVVEDE